MKYDNPYENDSMPTKSGSKGFYIALAVCLVAVCGVAVATFVGNLSTDKSTTQTTQTIPTTVAQVDTPISDVTDERTTTTTTTMSTTTTVTTTVYTTMMTNHTTTATTADLFVFPASNRIVTPYSDELVYSETLGEWRTHNGVDFFAEQGQNVKAMADGTVTRCYRDVLWGDVVVIQHGGNVISRYYGVKAVGLKEGQPVQVGATIGTVSDIPAEAMMEAHVHVEVLANDKYVDPLTLIRGKTVTTRETTNTK